MTSTGSPSPRKLRVDSIDMLELMLEITTNRMEETKFGIRWRVMILGKLMPMQRAARTYSLLRIWRTSLRTIRASGNHPVIPIMKERVKVFCFPITDTSKRTVRRFGMLLAISAIRIMIASTLVFANPLMHP